MWMHLIHVSCAFGRWLGVEIQKGVGLWMYIIEWYFWQFSNVLTNVIFQYINCDLLFIRVQWILKPHDMNGNKCEHFSHLYQLCAFVMLAWMIFCKMFNEQKTIFKLETWISLPLSYNSILCRFLQFSFQRGKNFLSLKIR